MHNAFGPAIDYGQDEQYYYLNGRKTSANIVNLEFTREEFINEQNEDVRASMITVLRERNGEKGVLDFLNAEEVDTKKIEHGSGHVETVSLYKTKEKYSFLQDRHGAQNKPYCWSIMVCPSTGATYTIANCPSFTDAVEAMKFLRPNGIPLSLDYNFLEFNN